MTRTTRIRITAAADCALGQGRKGETVEHLSLSRGARVASMLRVGGGVDRLAVSG